MRDEDGNIKTIVARHRDPAKADLARASAASTFSTTRLRPARPQSTTGTTKLFRRWAPTRTPLQSTRSMQRPFVSWDTARSSRSRCFPTEKSREVSASCGRLTNAASPKPIYRRLKSSRGGRVFPSRTLGGISANIASPTPCSGPLCRVRSAIPGFCFDAYYQAGRREAAIGGDWFDAFVTPRRQLVVWWRCRRERPRGSRPHGEPARQIIRTATIVGNADPTMLLDVADSRLRSEHGDSMATVFVGVIDPQLRTMTYASAGHLPALLRMPDKEVIELRAGGLPLGCRDMAPGQNRTIALVPGSSLLLFTDGLVEWSRDLRAGLAKLRETFAAFGCRVHSAKALVESVLPAAGARDDIAALLVTVDPAD